MTSGHTLDLQPHCHTCYGTRQCPSCRGSGHALCMISRGRREVKLLGSLHTCLNCNGTGQHALTPCITCDGAERVAAVMDVIETTRIGNKAAGENTKM